MAYKPRFDPLKYRPRGSVHTGFIHPVAFCIRSWPVTVGGPLEERLTAKLRGDHLSTSKPNRDTGEARALYEVAGYGNYYFPARISSADPAQGLIYVGASVLWDNAWISRADWERGNELFKKYKERREADALSC